MSRYLQLFQRGNFCFPNVYHIEEVVAVTFNTSIPYENETLVRFERAMWDAMWKQYPQFGRGAFPDTATENTFIRTFSEFCFSTPGTSFRSRLVKISDKKVAPLPSPVIPNKAERQISDLPRYITTFSRTNEAIPGHPFTEKVMVSLETSLDPVADFRAFERALKAALAEQWPQFVRPTFKTAAQAARFWAKYPELNCSRPTYDNSFLRLRQNEEPRVLTIG